MANEFIARKGLIVLSNGAKITGSFSVSSDSIFNGPVTASTGATGSFTGSFRGDGSQLTGLVTDLRITGSTGTDTVSLLTDSLSLLGSNGVTTVVTNNTVTIGIPTGTVSASSQVDHNATTNYVANQHIDHSTVNITAGSGLSGGGDITATRTLTLDTSSVHFLDGVKKELNTEGVVSSSSQIDVRNTTGIATIATTGSNTFTGVQTISNTTNSTVFSNGALVVDGGVGIAKDVNISGSLTVTGLLTAVSMSTQYVTSSQYVVGVSRIILNDDDTVRFAGISIEDSGSSFTTASILWDSQNHHFIYDTISGSSYESAWFIAGPQNTGSLGDEVGLITGRIPVASGDNNIDTNPTLTPLRVEGTTLHAEGNVYVTGSVTASAFFGDGSNLTGIVTNLNITGSDGGTGTVSLKTQALTVDGTNGLTATVSGQTITISGSDATTSTKGVSAFNSANFSVVGGQVTASAITFNSVPLNLGSAYSFGLANITSQGATTADQLVLNGGARIHGVLYSSGSNTDVDTGTEVVATVQTGSYDAAFFDYVVKKGSSYRAGTVMAVWEAGTSNVEFTDTSTNDLGNTTDVVFVVDILSATARLKATVASDNWIVKTAIRAL
jgi:trimeric autotransporter adhesin